MLFSFGQSSDCFAILRNLLKKHYSFPAKRPADAKEDHVLGESHSLASSLGQSSDCFAILRNLLRSK